MMMSLWWKISAQSLPEAVGFPSPRLHEQGRSCMEKISRIFTTFTFVTPSAWLLSSRLAYLIFLILLSLSFLALSRVSFQTPTFHALPAACTSPYLNMSDDEEYYEWDDEYLYEDVVPDFIVSVFFVPGLMCNRG